MLNILQYYTSETKLYYYVTLSRHLRSRYVHSDMVGRYLSSFLRSFKIPNEVSGGGIHSNVSDRDRATAYGYNGLWLWWVVNSF